MIAEPHDPNQPGRQADKIAGLLKKSALILAAVEFVVYWLLVFYFPAAMAVASVLLGASAWYFRRMAGSGGTLGETLELSARDLELLDKYCKTWIYIAAYGAAFAIFLVLRG